MKSATIDTPIFDPEVIQRAITLAELIPELEHLFCWCIDHLSLCGVYQDDGPIVVMDDDFEPSCKDCAEMTHCIYCGCKIGDYRCSTCYCNWTAHYWGVL